MGFMPNKRTAAFAGSFLCYKKMRKYGRGDNKKIDKYVAPEEKIKYNDKINNIQ